MAYLSDIEIAQSAKMRPITEIAANAGVPEEALEQYGRYKAKIDPAKLPEGKQGKLILVTAITSRISEGSSEPRRTRSSPLASTTASLISGWLSKRIPPAISRITAL